MKRLNCPYCIKKEYNKLECKKLVQLEILNTVSKREVETTIISLVGRVVGELNKSLVKQWKKEARKPKTPILRK